MSYCINPKCPKRRNLDAQEYCQACGTTLLIQQRYRLLQPLRELDASSHTEVFTVDDRGTEKVLKVLKNLQFLSMFEREAHTLQKLKHPGIPKVDSDGYFCLANQIPQQYCLVMEKIEGQNLEQWLQQHEPLSQTQALIWLRQLLEVLEKVHQNQLFHRDIKPSNIMLKNDGQLALIDFGTVRQVSNTYLAKIGAGRDVTGIISPGYTPLEQINGKAVPQSDFYALGRCFVYLLTGIHPIDFAEDAQTGQIDWRESAPQISPWFADLIDHLIAPFPGKRPLNTEEIVQRLVIQDTQPLLKPVSKKSRWHWLIVVNLVLLIGQLVTGLFWLQAKQQLSDHHKSYRSTSQPQR